MRGKAPDQNQLDCFKATLKQMIDPKHTLLMLAQAIPWKKLEEKFKNLYAHTGAPIHHLRKMIAINSYNVATT